MSSYYCNSDNVINYVTHPNCSPNTNIAKDVIMTITSTTLLPRISAGAVIDKFAQLL